MLMHYAYIFIGLIVYVMEFHSLLRKTFMMYEIPAVKSYVSVFVHQKDFFSSLEEGDVREFYGNAHCITVCSLSRCAEWLRVGTTQ